MIFSSCTLFFGVIRPSGPAFSQSKEISSDLCCFCGGGVSHNEDIMHSFQKFIVVSFPTTLPLQKHGYGD